MAVSRKWAAGPGSCPGPDYPHAPPRGHAGPLCLCAATAPNAGAHRRRLPVPQLWCPYLRPRAGCYQCPCPSGPLEETYAPEEGQSPVTAAQTQTGNKLLLNPSNLFRSGFCRLSHGLPVSFREGWGLRAGGLPRGGGLQLGKALGRTESPKLAHRYECSPPTKEFPCCHTHSSCSLPEQWGAHCPTPAHSVPA